MRPRNLGNFVPDDGTASCWRSAARCNKSQTFHALRVQMNLAAVILRQTLYQFRCGAFRPVPPVYKRGNHGDSQVSASKGAGVVQWAR